MPTGVHANERRPSGDGASAIAATLEEDIVLGLLSPKVRLVEDELMERFKAKRHVVREALNQLESVGLVERKRNIGALVKAFSKAEVVHLYEMRELLEAESMRKIPLPLSKDALQQLHKIQAGHDAAIQNQDPRNIFRTNQEFHRLLFAQCGNAFLAQTIEDFARKTHAIRFGALISSEPSGISASTLSPGSNTISQCEYGLRKRQRVRTLPIPRQPFCVPRYNANIIAFPPR